MLILSLGENCLPGMLLKRFGITNTWSTPYTYARTNIDQCLLWEKENYRDLLNNKYIGYDVESTFPNVYRNKKYYNLNKNYHKSVQFGFEFTHHDITKNQEAYNSYGRKINRMKELKYSDEDILFIYHHRYTGDYNYDEIIEKCDEYATIYKNKGRKCYIAIIVQELNENRYLEYKKLGDIIIFKFHAKKEWKGNIEGMVSGEVDDDLFVEFFETLYAENYISTKEFLKYYCLSPICFLKRDNFKQNLSKNFILNGDERFYLWGYGKYGKEILKYLEDNNVSVDGVIDKKAEIIVENNKEIPIITFLEIVEPAQILVTISDDNAISEIKEQTLASNVTIKTFQEIRDNK